MPELSLVLNTDLEEVTRKELSSMGFAKYPINR